MTFHSHIIILWRICQLLYTHSKNSVRATSHPPKPNSHFKSRLRKWMQVFTCLNVIRQKYARSHAAFQQTVHDFLLPAVIAELAQQQTLHLLSSINTQPIRTLCCAVCFHTLPVNMICVRDCSQCFWVPDASSVVELKWWWLAAWSSNSEVTAIEYQRPAPTVTTQHGGTGGLQQITVALLL